MPVVRVEKLTKIYRRQGLLKTQEILAVDNLSFTLEDGQVLGLIGPNGAGKTSTLKMLINYTLPTCGHLEIFGQTIRRDDFLFRCQLGFLPEETFLPVYQKVEEFLLFCASFFGVGSRQLFQNIRGYLKIFDLEDKLKLSLASLSMGQRRAVGILQALVNNPKLVILDEPTVYLDPVAVRSFGELIFNLKKAGCSVIISSHILTQIQEICDEVLIINRGKACAYGKTAELTRQESLENLFLRLIAATVT